MPDTTCNPYGDLNTGSSDDVAGICTFLIVVAALVSLLFIGIGTTSKEEDMKSQAELIACQRMNTPTSYCKEIIFDAEKAKALSELKEKNNK